MKLLYERHEPYPIIYTFSPKPKWHKINYRWLHIPTGKTGAEMVWVSRKEDICSLLDVWNSIGRQEWKYWQI